MFKANKFSMSKKFIIEQNFKNYLNDSVNKYNKLTIQINEDAKRKKAIENILYGNALVKSTNHSVNDLINNAKFYNCFFIFSLVSIGALICYKSKQ